MSVFHPPGKDSARRAQYQIYLDIAKPQPIYIAGIRDKVQGERKSKLVCIFPSRSRPPATAYGAEGDAELGIGPNATLYYERELVDVVKYSTRRR